MSSILVVEDEGFIVRVLKDALRREGYQTVVALNGDDAVQFALREIPHLFVIDFRIASVNGYELVRRLRDHPKCMHIPIIALSPYSTAADRVYAFELGVDNYVTWPVNSDELLALARRQLRRLQQSSLSPLTKLPGGLQLERAIDHKLSSSEPWSILYLDLDNFKAFNDVYGFLAGNEMILLVGRICQRVVYEYGNADDFVGHVGGDDFVIVTTPERTKIFYRQILERFKDESAVLYRLEDLERGGISGIDRKGLPAQFPLVSLSVGVVSDQIRCSRTIDEISTLAAEAKWRAKRSSNSVFLLSPQREEAVKGYPHSSFSSSLFYRTNRLNRNLHSLFPFISEDAFVENINSK